MKRTLMISIIALALVPATASAAFVSGLYKGRTGNGGPVTLRATQTKLSGFSIGVVFNCTDGDRFQTVLRGFPRQNIVNGYYNATFTGSGGASKYVNKGRLLNRRATGTFTGTRRYDENDQLDPSGTVVCRTGTVRYSIPRFSA